MSTTEHRPLTAKEDEVFRLVAVGLTNEQISGHIETGVDNVKSHIRSIFGKVGANSRTQAVSLGFRKGLLDREDIDALAVSLDKSPATVED
jgi:DNA-binding CsgD family transcriptional regulator